MSSGPAPQHRRTTAEVVADLLQRRPGYVPAWSAQPGDPGLAVIGSNAAMLAALWERLDAAPDKNKLAFLSELGIDSLPAASARAPVVFEPIPGSGNATVPKGSLLGADAEDGQQLTFRTEHSIGLTSSRLADVRSVVPGRDSQGDHTAEVMGGRPVTLFQQQTQIERYLYIGHDELLAIRGDATVSIEFTLSRDASTPLELRWSIWDGDVWREFPDASQFSDTGQQLQIFDQTVVEIDGHPGSLGRSGTISRYSDCIAAAPTEVDGIESYWLRAELITPLSGINALQLPEIDQIRLAVRLGDPTDPVEFPVETAVALGQEVDPASPFHPFGQTPDRTSLFYVDATALALTGLTEGELRGTVEIPAELPESAPNLIFEFWNGSRWVELTRNNLGVGSASSPTTNPIDFKVGLAIPFTWQDSDVAGVAGRWFRVRIPDGEGYGARRAIEVAPSAPAAAIEGLAPSEVPAPPLVPTVEIDVLSPPVFFELRLAAHGTSPATAADHVIGRTGALFRNETEGARWRGSPFLPFEPNLDDTPTLYVGFDGPLPVGNLGLYLDIGPTAGQHIGGPSHQFRWERYDGRQWVSLPVEDETAHLTRSGITRLLWPGNRRLRSVSPVAGSGFTAITQSTNLANTFVAGEELHIREGEKGELTTVVGIDAKTIRFDRPLTESYQNATLSEPEPPLFGLPRTWIRARLTESPSLPNIVIRRLLHNATWASENRAVENETLGSSNSQPDQEFLSISSILPGERLQVRELTGARARTDLAVLQRELEVEGQTAPVETDQDEVGNIEGVWVKWESRSNLLNSGPGDRHYVVDRNRGAVRFGDGRTGRIPPTGLRNVRLSYETGGGTKGNVPAEAIATPLSGILAAKVYNPVAATAGADSEVADEARRRAPRVVRHRRQAVSAGDFRDVAIEASPEVFDAAAVAAPDDLGGALRLLVLPNSQASPPEPSDQLLSRVARFVSLRCPAGAAGGLRLEAPRFVPVGVEVVVAAEAGRAGEVFDRVRAALTEFLHPVTGGPIGSPTNGGPPGQGWSFGSIIHTARFAPLLESVDGVDFVESFVVTSGGAIVGDEFMLAPDELPTAGMIDVQLTREVG